ncbi:MAG: cytochrome c biogenesis protein CcdA [Thermoleophilia bacterium]|nr:cytochrome c biogenesis protein CcdA [Thermoleophilia bacterium]
MNAVPVSVALVAGGLSVVNPCGFPLLPAFLSFYLGADEDELPRAPTRVLQGLLVGGLVTTGFLGLFALASLPVSFGVALVARAVPWAGLATGALLALAGLVTLSGRHLTLPVHLHVPVKRERRLGAMLLFGVGYGAASLGCTLPLFLTLIAASGGADKLTVFGAYAAGTAIVLTAVSVLTALAREGIARAVRPTLPYMSRIAGGLLVIAGGYLVYYWARLRFGDTATVADDPVVSFAIRFSGRVRTLADGRGSILVAGAGAVVAAALVITLLHWRRQANASRLVSE